MESYFYHKMVLERIRNSSVKMLDDDETDENWKRNHHPVQRGRKCGEHICLQYHPEKATGSVQREVSRGVPSWESGASWRRFLSNYKSHLPIRLQPMYIEERLAATREYGKRKGFGSMEK